MKMLCQVYVIVLNFVKQLIKLMKHFVFILYVSYV